MDFAWWQLLLGFLATSGLTTFGAEAVRKVWGKKKDDFEFYKDQIKYLQTEAKDARDRSADKSKEISRLWDRIEEKEVEIRRLDTELNIEKIEKVESDYNKCDITNCLNRTPPRSKNSIAKELAKSYIEDYKSSKSDRNEQRTTQLQSGQYSDKQ